MSLTAAQSQAVAAQGNVLVIAGAGTGKTRTLVERCLKCLLDDQPPADLEQILMVTFTEAAASEMRHRIRTRLEQRAEDPSRKCAAREHLALFDTAQIGTLHSFCLQLVRQHFYDLELDPQVAVLAQEEARLLEQETLDALLEDRYNGTDDHSAAIQRLMEAYGRGSEKNIRALILKLFHYTQSRPDPECWFASQLQAFCSAEPGQWQIWLVESISDWVRGTLPAMESGGLRNPVAAACAALLADFPVATPSAWFSAFEDLVQTPAVCPKGRKQAFLEPLKAFYKDARFLRSLCPPPEGNDPLQEDWEWVRTHMATLLQLTRDFTGEFTRAKRELGLVDFHDLEQHSLRLLWNAAADKPSLVAEAWRQRLKHVFVDEYQDINAAQDKIIECLSRPDSNGNRFLVGDLKQSIYRFRLADPHIFARHSESWRHTSGTVVPLVENFRSREGILNFVNSVFAAIMQPSLGGVAYDAEACLVFGAAETRQELSAARTALLPVELHLRTKTTGGSESREPADSAEPDLADLQEADKEARMVTLRLIELHQQKFPVWDDRDQQFRPVAWGDMAILLRSPSNKAENYAKEFARFRVPLTVERGGFYESLEVSDLLNLLRLLDNPLQDVPLLAVLHSPIVGLTAAELAEIRLALKGSYWAALTHWHKAAKAQPPPPQVTEAAPNDIGQKVDSFLNRYRRWRRLARQVSLSRCLEAVLTETHYSEWVLAQSRGEQRRGNVQRLLHLAHQFDRFQRQSLFRFLQFVEAQQLTESEPEPAGAGSGDSVRLMSIHQSKGLEFPIVVAADLAKPFNRSDLHADVILDERFGLCPLVKSPKSGKRYPSLPFWLARQRQDRELLGEELRLLYVAMTRARDLLVLSATTTESDLANRWQPDAPPEADALASAARYLDWLALWWRRHSGAQKPPSVHGQTKLLRWRVWDDTQLAVDQPQPLPATAMPATTAFDPEALVEIQRRIEWEYPFVSATTRPAKSSVTTLRRLADSESQENAAIFPAAPSFVPRRKPKLRPGLSAAEIGTAHHLFLQYADLSLLPNTRDLRAEAQRLQGRGLLSPEEAASLDFASLVAFWSSSAGTLIRAAADHVRRELPFTVGFTPDELATLCAAPAEPGLENELIVVQGTVDLVVLGPDKLWLLDFKSDEVTPRTLADKVRIYAPQLRLYAAALQKIYLRPLAGSWLHFLRLGQTVSVSGPEQLQLSI